MVHGSVPCTREKLLGTDSWALEIPILASNNSNSNELKAMHTTSTKAKCGTVRVKWSRGPPPYTPRDSAGEVVTWTAAVHPIEVGRED